MKIRKLILLIGLFTLTITSVLSQELKNVELQTVPLQDLALTPYGIIVYYTTSTIYQGTFYLPSKWFQTNATYEEGAQKIIAVRKFTRMSLNKDPILNIKYVDGKLTHLTLLLPGKFKSYGIPEYRGSKENLEEIKKRFDRQATLDYLPFEENQ